jgi:hypothetical protein
MTVKCANIFNSKALQNEPKFGFLVGKIASGNPGPNPFAQKGIFISFLNASRVTRLGEFLPFGRIFAFWANFCLLGEFLPFGRIFAFWANFRLLGD